MHEPRPIVVATDYSECSRFALRYAVDFARALHAPLSLVHADLFLAPEGYGESGASWYLHELPGVKVLADERLHEYAAELLPADVEWNTRVCVGAAGPVIAREVHEQSALLLVMGTHGSSGLRRLVLGSTAASVARHVDVPVLMVRERDGSLTEDERRIRSVVCPVSPSLDAVIVATNAAALCRALGAELIVVELRRHAATLDEEAASRAIRGEIEGVGRVLEREARGDVASEVLRLAGEFRAQLIVVGAESPSTERVADRERREITRHSLVPVLSIRPSRPLVLATRSAAGLAALP